MNDAVPAVIEDIGPKSRFFELHADYWAFVKKYLNGSGQGIRDDVYWENLVHDADLLAKKYEGAYTRGLILNLLDELDRRSRHEREIQDTSVH